LDYKDAEEGPSRAGTQDSSSSPEQEQEEGPPATMNKPKPRQVEDVLVEPNQPTSPTPDEDIFFIYHTWLDLIFTMTATSARIL
jgi:hypothetical protein